MKKLILIISFLWAFGSFAQSSFYNNAVWNLKDPRSTNIYKLHYLNNTDSILTIDSVGLNFIRASRYKGWSTLNRPAFAVAGMIGYNTDSAKFEFYNGSAWGTFSASTSSSYTAGSGLTLTGSQFKLGGTISENTSLSTGGAYTWQLTDGTTPIIHSDVNERVSIGGTNNAGNKFYVNGTMGAADGSVLFSFASASLQYYAPSSDMIIRLNGRGEEWRFTKFTSSFDIYPVTTNADPLRFRDNANGDIMHIVPSNKTVLLFSVPAATSTDTKLLVHGNSDSAIRQLDFPIVQGTYTATKTDVTNIGTASVSTLHYQRLGDYIEVGGEITIDPTATGDTHLRITLPIASTITNSYDLFGTASAHDVNQVVRIYGDTVNSAAIFRLTVADASSHVYSFKFRYKYVAP